MPDSDALHKQLTKQAGALTAVAQLISVHILAGDYDAAWDSLDSIAEHHLPAFEKLLRQWETNHAHARDRSRGPDAKA
jgi:hypothetical protein